MLLSYLLVCKNPLATSFAQGVLEIWNGCMVSDILRFLFHQFQLHWCCPRRDGMATRRRKGTVRTKHLFRWTMELQTAAARLSSFSHSILHTNCVRALFWSRKVAQIFLQRMGLSLQRMVPLECSRETRPDSFNSTDDATGSFHMASRKRFSCVLFYFAKR